MPVCRDVPTARRRTKIAVHMAARRVLGTSAPHACLAAPGKTSGPAYAASSIAGGTSGLSASCRAPARNAKAGVM